MEPNNKLVWYPDAKHGFAIGRIVDIASERASVEPVAAASPFGPQFEQVEGRGSAAEFAYKSLFACDLELDELSGADVDDSCALIQLHEAALLENVRLRFHRDKIYTYVAHILIAVNPYCEVRGLHSPDAIRSYQGKSLGTLAPHVYAIADKAVRDMRAFRRSQSIIISGESGAGKTESQKYVLRYLCLSGSQAGRLEQLILDANPILEAFGNAKTIRNNNSSRFGKFIEIHYSAKFTVTGGLFFHYLLEKSRICTQSAGERNYHIFYQLCACLPQDQWSHLELGSPDKFRYLSSGCTQYFCSQELDAQLPAERKSELQLSRGAIRDQLIDELACFRQTELALANFGLGERQRRDLYAVVASLLHLGNVAFCEEPEESRGGCRVAADGRAERSLATAARLMGLDEESLRQALTTRVMSTARGGHKGTVYMVQLTAQQASAARDALAKAIYARLFDHIVSRVVNRSIPFASSAFYIGVLDVAGFEYFQRNSFEQFLINFCNERLQQFFNERVLKEEQSIYEKEALELSRVEFVDNQDCIQLLEAKSVGLFDLLDEECRLPKPSARHFTQSVHERNRGHFRLALPRASKLRQHRELRDDEGFLVRHFAGAVCYETGSFIDKNNDALHASLRGLMLEASHGLLRDLFADSAERAPSGQPVAQLTALAPAGAGAIKLNFATVGTTFRSQLAELMQKLRSTGSHFIRCVKPNGEMVARKFEGAQVLSQLHCSGMDSVLRLMQQGYPSRASFNDLYQSYKRFLPAELARLDSHLFCRALFKAVGLADSDFRFGSSKVFFRPGKFAEFDQIIRSDGEHVAELVRRVSRWLLRSRWRKAQFCCLSAVKLQNKILFRRQLIVRLQRHWRAALVAARLKFRLAAIKLARQLDRSLEDFQRLIGEQLGGSSERPALEQQADLLRQEVGSFIGQLTGELQRALVSAETNNNTDSAHGQPKPAAVGEARRRCQQRLETLSTKRDLLVRSIGDKIAERRQLQQLERRVAAESRRREQEALAERQEATIKRQRGQLELRRQEELRRLAAVASSSRPQESGAAGAGGLSSAEEQEQRDHEIARRLAQEADGPGQPAGRQPLAPSENHAASPALAGYELSRWKYSDLRDTINTSCDLELLEACKREFHRRLKVYHAWRAANSRQAHSGELAARAPSSVMAGTASAALEAAAEPAAASEQRYFRIPFLRSAAQAAGRGWWFAHFDGQWIARQLELHPGRAPILLVAGQHDIEMCELSLAETRLTTKRGAEILPQEFEEEWTKHGGQAYRARHEPARRAHRAAE